MLFWLIHCKVTANMCNCQTKFITFNNVSRTFLRIVSYLCTVNKTNTGSLSAYEGQRPYLLLIQ